MGRGPRPGVTLTKSRHPVNVPLEGGPNNLKFGLFVYIPPFPIVGLCTIGGEEIGTFYTDQ